MDTEKLLTDYTNWLRRQYSIRKIDDTDEVTTPFLNMIGDNMRIFITQLEGDKIQVTDDGTTLQDLELFGIDTTSRARKQIIQRVKKLYTIDQIDDVLSITGDVKNFPVMKQKLTSAMIQINDLSQTKKSNVEAMFYEEVLSYLSENKFGGLEEYPLKGKSGVPYKINYAIPETTERPLRLVNFKHHLGFNESVLSAYTFNDIMMSSFKSISKANFFIIYDNSDGKIPTRAEQIIDHAGITPLPWENKELIETLR